MNDVAFQPLSHYIAAINKFKSCRKGLIGFTSAPGHEVLVCSPHCDLSIPSQETIWKGPVKETELLRLSAVVSGINLLLPGLFNLCAWVEKHDSPSVSVYVSILR